MKPQKGSSLLEIVVAMLILSIVAAGLVGLFVTNYKFLVQARNRLQAMNYARQVAERLKVHVTAVDITTPPVGPPLTVRSHNPSAPSPELNLTPPLPGPPPSYTVSSVAGTTGLREVRITVQWTES